MQRTRKLTSKLNESKLVKVEMEHCQNPWNSECNNPDIELYIVNKGGKIPICRFCWQKITESDVEW